MTAARGNYVTAARGNYVIAHIERIPGSHRYQVTDTGLTHAGLLTRVHDRLVRTGLSHLADPDTLTPSPLRKAAAAFQAAIDDLARQAGLAV